MRAYGFDVSAPLREIEHLISMSEPNNILPELKQIVGSLLFATKEPLSIKQVRRILVETGEFRGGMFEEFTFATEKDVAVAIQYLRDQLLEVKTGIHVQEVAQGFRLTNDPDCGPWIRQMLDKNKSARLSKPALETLAVIAYRQPCTRAEIEAVRGVSVDSMVRNLVEMQLVKSVGRSELPGRPWMFGTTHKFLQHFGLNSIDELPGIAELKRNEPKPDPVSEPVVDDLTAPLFSDEEMKKTENGTHKDNLNETEGQES